MENLKKYEKIAVLLIVGSAVLVFLGLLQYGLSKDQDFFRTLSLAFYGIFAYMGGNGVYDKGVPDYIYISAFAIPVGVTMGVVLLFGYRFKRWIRLVFKPNDYSLIVGFKEYGYAFYKNSKDDENIYIICDDVTSSLALKAIDDQALIYKENSKILRALVKGAKEIYLLDNEDIDNIKTAMKIKNIKDIESNKDKIKMYIHLKNKEFEIFYSPVFSDSYDNYEVISFSIYQRAVMKWFDEHCIKGNIDTTKKDAQSVAVLLVGWDSIIKEALWHILNIAHFYNEKPVKVIIAIDDVEPVQQEVEFLYPKIFGYCSTKNHLGQKFWDIEFVDLQKYYKELGNEPFDFTNILISLETIERSTQVAYKFLDLHLESIEKNCTKIGIFSDSFEFKKSINNKVNIETFGNFENLFVEEVMLCEDLHKGSKELRELYKDNKKEDDPWAESLFDYWSNAYAHIHGKLKKREFEKFKSNKDESLDKEEVSDIVGDIFVDTESGKLKEVLFEAYLKALSNIKAKTPQEKIDILEQFAKVEHTRWSAYHILNGYVYDDKKDKNHKKHDCLISWDRIKKEKSHTIKYDIENVLNSLGYIGEKIK